LEYRVARMGLELLVMNGWRHHQTNNVKTVWLYEAGLTAASKRDPKFRRGFGQRLHRHYDSVIVAAKERDGFGLNHCRPPRFPDNGRNRARCSPSS
jgi:hypothetical protein